MRALQVHAFTVAAQRVSLSLALLTACITESTWAAPTIVAKLNLTAPDTALRGEVRFDLSGGPLLGQADLDVLSDPVNPPRRTDGGTARGRFQVRIELEGTYHGGSFGVVHGAAHLTGTFTDESGCQAEVAGKGTFKGSVSGPIGSAELDCDWKEMAFYGCQLSSPQPFAAALRFSFDRTDVIPTLHDEESGQQPAFIDRWIWWILAGVAVVVAIATFLVRRRR